MMKGKKKSLAGPTGRNEALRPGGGTHVNKAEKRAASKLRHEIESERRTSTSDPE